MSSDQVTALILSRLDGIPQTVPLPVRVLGIDLGTTNSTVAEVIWCRDQNQPPVARCLEIEQPTDTGPYIHVLVPSVVALHGGQVWVGEGAKRLRANPRLRRNRDIFYECKNEIGARRTYHLAPPGFRSAAEIGGRVLSFLKAAAETAHEVSVARTVVTVPASFQLAQRHDTFRAAEMAGMNLQAGDLLDEPVAAFIDYLVTHREALLADLRGTQNVVVFDFGGGTCDVAVFRLDLSKRSGQLEIAPLAVSRYHRLGGGDIDAAIVHEELIPQVAEQNGLKVESLDFDQRKRHLEPALLGIAESLKVGLCIEIARLQSFGRYADADKTEIVKTHPGSWSCPCPGYPTLTLRSPRLTAARFEELLKPFLDRDLLYARETEYHMTCSIFAPLSDALERAGLQAADVDFCLMVGGSSLIPQVQEAVRSYLRSGRLLIYEDRDATQVAVARGAAYHALALALYGRGLVQPVAQDAIALRVASGMLELVPKGATLPFPSPDRSAEHFELVVPQTALVGTVPLRVELVAGSDARPVFAATWQIRAPVNRGTPLRLGVRMDANQCLHLELTLRDQPETEPFACTVEHPLTLVVNPHATRQRIEEVEENLRTGKVAEEEIVDTLRKLSDDYAELGQLDKAIDYLVQALRRKGRPDASLLNSLGIRYGEKKDWERQEKTYREAFQAKPDWAGSLFNLALSQWKRGLLEAAEATIREALAVEEDPPYFVLLAQILEKRGNRQEANQALAEALKRYGPVRALSDWELGWLQTAAQMQSDAALLEEATAEQRRRKRAGKGRDVESGGLLPEIAPALRKI
ncbi:MAG: Hsp70 family protein [Methylacidiphilales bacterium]|nr:Hsp70 family protein [Candidatus Methylacidiphilales bacterium]